MKAKIILLVAAASLLGAFFVKASVTGVTDWGTSSGINCSVQLWDSSGDIVITGDVTGLGRMWGTITTSDTQDPTLSIANSIDNDSSFAWTAYIVNVSMYNPFTILSASASVPPSSDWTATITPPVYVGGGVYTGVIDYQGGTPVAIAPGPYSELDFSYQVQFTGATSYSLTESVIPVPEPATFSLLAAGGLLLVGGKVARRRQGKLRVSA